MNTLKQIETATCSTRGKRKRNDDYVLFEPRTGGCVADGVGGAPLGDAIARYACHIAQHELDHGSSASDAATSARIAAERFIDIVDAEGSGASLLVYRLRENGIDLAGYGNVACMNVPPAHQFSQQASAGDMQPDSCARTTCLGAQRSSDNSPKANSEGSTAQANDEDGRPLLVHRCPEYIPSEWHTPSPPIGSAGSGQLPHSYHFEEIGRLALCTDGVWKEIARSEVARILVEARTPREAAAMLTLGHQAQDNATALVMFGEDDSCNR